MHHDLVYTMHKQTGSHRLRQIELEVIIRYQAYIDAMEPPNATLYSGSYIHYNIRALSDYTEYYILAKRYRAWFHGPGDTFRIPIGLWIQVPLRWRLQTQMHSFPQMTLQPCFSRVTCTVYLHQRFLTRRNTFFERFLRTDTGFDISRRLAIFLTHIDICLVNLWENVY